MIKPKLTLRNFFQKQAEEEQEVTVSVDENSTTDETETTDDDPESEEPEQSDDTQDSNQSEGQSIETEPTAEQTAEATETIRVAELSQLRADAQNWANVQAELTQLRTWYATQKQGAKLPKGDVSDQGAGAQKSWERAPWNQ